MTDSRDWTGGRVPEFQQGPKVQVVIKHGDEVLSSRVVEDEWYASGGGQGPDRQQKVRDDTARTELAEFLSRERPTAGRYTVTVTEVGGQRRTWACVALDWPPQR